MGLSDGDMWVPPDLGLWSDMKDAAVEHGTRRRPKPHNAPPPINYSLVTLRNASGGDIVAGRVLQIGASEITTWDPEFLWFNGATPSPDGTDEFAIALNPTPSTDLSDFLLVGCCEAIVNINHEQHPYADVDSGSTLLQSKWHGRVRIIRKESTGTGQKNCLVRIGDMFRGPIDVIITQSGGIAPNGSGSAKVQLYDTTDASPTSTITVHYTRMPGSTNVGLNKHAEVWWNPRKQAYVILEAQC